ncbi:insulin-like growth factor-binding protein complex acid labile subunit [Neodiprion fabricii]|uniref:insulin-like growth factor-binding protein complex acid labile subunit n=1 Tax=Neodiprion fabricii TaxID=2872261 RepID=UPI001ED94A94|nr:insulin-like growth factor-binding protein complex acid labile subunit [Neodiprion fabricii]
MLLRALTIVWIAIGGIRSDVFDPPDPLELTDKSDLKYRPWDAEDASNTTWISLAGMGITHLGSSMFQLNIPNLKWLRMDNNRIERIANDSFKFFPNLTYLSLAGCDIQNIEPSAFRNLDSLKILDLDRNQLQYLSVELDWLINLHMLERLYLRNSNMQDFSVADTNTLKHLHLSGNQLSIFIFETPVSTELTHLYLDNNQLRYISLWNFKSLVYLNVANNQFGSIKTCSTSHYPSHGYNSYDSNDDSETLCLNRAPALQYLLLSNNQISMIETDVFRDIKTLVEVDLNNNQISLIHAGIFNNLLRIEYILLDSNEITDVNYHAFVNLPNLKMISLKYNKITDIDEDAFTKLNSSANEVSLFLDHNQIRILRRGSFRGIDGLKYIGLSNNKIRTISSQAFVDLPNLASIVIEDQFQSLDQSSSNLYDPYYHIQPRPRLEDLGLIESDAFFNLSNLTSIIIRRNLFTVIESRAFHDLPKLRTLDLSDNNIQILSSEVFVDLPELESLSLKGNEISAITEEAFGKLNSTANKVSLFLDSNKIHTLNTGSFRGIKGLNHIGLSHNEIKTISTQAFVDLPNLASILIEDQVADQSPTPMPFSTTEPGFFDDYEDGLNQRFLEPAKAFKLQEPTPKEIGLIESDAFSNLSNLACITIRRNSFAVIESQAFHVLPALTTLDLSYNRIRRLSSGAFDDLPKIERLDLRNNLISVINEDTFTDLNSKADAFHLQLDNNQIRTLSSGSFRGIKALNAIGFGGNRIKTILSQAFIDLPNLESIVIEYQPNDLIDERTFIASDAFLNLSNVTSITIRGNTFHEIKARAFHDLPELTELNLSENRIEILSSKAFLDVPKLENLYLHRNFIPEIEPNTFPKQLRNLDLSWNPICKNFSCWDVEELDQLTQLDLSGIIDRFMIDEFADLPRNLTVVVGQAERCP